MAGDRKLVKDEAPPRELHPVEDSPYPARCVDCIDLGLNPESFEGSDPVLKDKVALIFRTTALDKKNRPFEIGIEFNCTFGKKANLRKFAEAWRGKPYTEDEARKQGIPLEKFVGVPALLTIIHATSGKGNEYAKIGGISKLPAAMASLAPDEEGYERAKWWEDKKAEYARAAALHNDKHPAGGTSKITDLPEIDMDDPDGDALPF